MRELHIFQTMKEYKLNRWPRTLLGNQLEREKFRDIGSNTFIFGTD